MRKFRVTSRRLTGFADGDLVSEDGLVKCGLNVDKLLAKNLVAVVEYDEPRKHKSARKDASDTDKD